MPCPTSRQIKSVWVKGTVLCSAEKESQEKSDRTRIHMSLGSFLGPLKVFRKGKHGSMVKSHLVISLEPGMYGCLEPQKQTKGCGMVDLCTADLIFAQDVSPSWGNYMKH